MPTPTDLSYRLDGIPLEGIRTHSTSDSSLHLYILKRFRSLAETVSVLNSLSLVDFRGRLEHGRQDLVRKIGDCHRHIQVSQ